MRTPVSRLQLREHDKLWDATDILTDVGTLPTPTKSTLSASDDAWRCQAPASCQSLDQQACATARSRSSRCMALSYLLLLVPKCVPWPTPVHTHRAAVGAARALLQVFRSLAAVCSPSIVAFDFGFSDRSFSATLCEKIIHLITTSRVTRPSLLRTTECPRCVGKLPPTGAVFTP